MDKTTGTIRFNLTDFASFAAGTETRFSQPVFIRGMKWHVEAYPALYKGDRFLEVYLQCKGLTRYQDSDWAILVNATFKIHRVCDRVFDQYRKEKEFFHKSLSNIGCQLISFDVSNVVQILLEY